MDSITHFWSGSILSTNLIRKMASKRSILSAQKRCRSCTTLLTGKEQEGFGSEDDGESGLPTGECWKGGEQAGAAILQDTGVV